LDFGVVFIGGNTVLAARGCLGCGDLRLFVAAEPNFGGGCGGDGYGFGLVVVVVESCVMGFL
jgi:hypothetical protein